MLSHMLRASRFGKKGLFFITSGSTATSATSHTFSNVSIGSGQTNRIVVVLAVARTGNATLFSTCTIQGQTANTIIGTAAGGATTTGPRIIGSKFIPYGDTADITFTLGQPTTNGLAYHVYALYGPSSDVAAVSGQRTPNVGLISLAITLNGLLSGDMIIMEAYKTNTAAPTWTNATQDVAQTITTGNVSYSASNNGGLSGNQTITMSWAGSTGGGAIAAAWR